MGLMKLFTDKGYQVQPFKCGPDYLDTKFHSLATGKPSVNLDIFMASQEHLKKLYNRYSHTADICIVESMMGMYDGYDRYKGSSAEIAQLLNIPVVLVIDARSCSYSVAPLIHGFSTFMPGIKVVGVIFNYIGSEKHEKMLREACLDARVECFGCIPKEDDWRIPYRYLGLNYGNTKGSTLPKLWARIIKKHIDFKLLLKKTSINPVDYVSEPEQSRGSLRITVAKNNESFCFIYQETIEKLQQLGDILYVDPERDKELPADTDILYLPGGYPEKHPLLLRDNNSMRESVYQYIENGGRALAECGGMIYLSKGIIRNNHTREMVGIFPFYIEKMYRTLGYRQLEYNGLKLRGHEFHYTQFTSDDNLPESVTQVYNAKGEPVDTPVFRYKNVIASYTHLYLGETDILKLWED